MGKRLLLIGGGGHCHSVLDSVLAAGLYDEIGIVDRAGAPYLGVPVIAADDALPSLIREGWTDAFVAVGSVGNTGTRRRLFDTLRQLGFSVPTILDPTAVIGRGVEIREGVFVGKRAIINAGCSVGACSIINSAAILEHDCVIGAFSHISPGAILCGQVRVGDDSHIGAGAVVRQSIEIGRGALIGAGSVVVRNIPGHVKAYGNPCRVAES